MAKRKSFPRWPTQAVYVKTIRRVFLPMSPGDEGYWKVKRALDAANAGAGLEKLIEILKETKDEKPYVTMYSPTTGCWSTIRL